MVWIYSLMGLVGLFLCFAVTFALYIHESDIDRFPALTSPFTIGPTFMTIRDRLLDLNRQRAALAQTIATFEAERQKALAGLPASFGFKTLNGFIKAVKDAAKPAPKPRKFYSRNVTRPLRPRKQVEAAAVDVAASTPVAIEAPATAFGSPASVIPAAAPSIPVGSDLTDPANFRLLPDSTLLDPTTLEFEGSAYVDKLTKALTFARQVMATSKVPAAVWREWRDFEKQAGEVLRGRHRQVLPDSE